MSTLEKILFDLELEKHKAMKEIFHLGTPVGYSRNPYKAEFVLRPSEKYLFSLNFKETDKEYIYTADLVGLDKSKLHLQIEGLKATLSYDNPEDKRRQKFEYTFTLPEIADTETVYTSYENGELKIVIEKLKRKIKSYSFN